MRIFLTFLLSLPLLFASACNSDGQSDDQSVPEQVQTDSTGHDTVTCGRVLTSQEVKVGAERTELYFNKLKGKVVALVANQSSMVDEKHLLDTLIGAGIKVEKIFIPEHGFRGEAAAGETVSSGTDPATGVKMVSLYGSNKKPKAADLKGVDIILYDIQDVGVRFYTYISTLHYVMEAAAENNVPVLVLDRPNPNGFYFDGPVLEKEFTSFVGMHPVPVVHGMTIAEYAGMINGEGWLKDSVKADLEVVTIEDYTHCDLYQLPINPSPNLQTMESVYLYPSLCLFEGTTVSVGRGTDKPFMVIGHPQSDTGDYYFTPRNIPGVSGNPPHLGKKCRGFDLESKGKLIPESEKPFSLEWLMLMQEHVDDDKFFNNFFNKLAGNSSLKEKILAGETEENIRRSWESDLKVFSDIRSKYLLYRDFNETSK